MRIGVPVIGPSLLIFARVGFAALFLLVIAVYLRKSLNMAQHWKHYLVLGLFNSALPFLLFAYGAQTVSASLLSILNATAPIWAAVIGAVWLRSRPSLKTLFGMLLGMVGVSVLAGFESVSLAGNGGLAIAAGLGASFCYGIATTYAKSAPSVEPFANAHGSMWGATLWMMPLAVFAPPIQTTPSALVIFCVVALGVVCSGIAYLLYFRLISDIGPAPALTVTYLVPVFGILWGALFLGEQVGWHTLAGSLLILTGTALVTGFSASAIFATRTKPTSA